MKVKIKTLSYIKYRGHVIRKVETEYGCDVVLIDNDANEIETAPVLMCEQDFTYASVADAKRFINGEAMTWMPEEADILGAKYWDRFKSK